MVNRILVLGNGPCARQIAQELFTCGKTVSLVTSEKDSVIAQTKSIKGEAFEWLTGASVSACRGQVGDFQITLLRNRDRFIRNAGIIVISEAAERRSNVQAYGLTPSASVLSISETPAAIENRGALLKGKKVVFLTGLHHETEPSMLEDILRAASRIQTECHSQTYVLTNNLKVAGNGLERLVREIKSAGSMIQKFTDPLPRIVSEPAGSVHISFVDPVTRQPFVLAPDLIVVDETIEPSPYLRALSRIFELDTDPSGFLQTDNVHRLSVSTNRKGIIAAGPARSIQTDAQQSADAKAAVITALSLAEPTEFDGIKKAEIHTGRCIRCLTCFRICPYRAIMKTPKVQIVPGACEGCGICTAECPRRAIQLDRVGLAEISDRLVDHRQQTETDASAPFLVVFCCKRSAMTAGEAALLQGFRLPENMLLVPVPCAGSISTAHILAAYQHGADGVLVFTCHDGNCHSERGNRFAAGRVGLLADTLSKIGMAPDRLLLDSLAANMAAEFAQKVNRFEERIRQTGNP